MQVMMIRKGIEMFRKLRADEIECRTQSIKKNGLVLLLYKDARADMRLLDETVGQMNWQKSYSRENANCTVSIWDKEKGQWISKEDTGTESNTEAQKGLASDSFKRACFNWGIGRELYTAPFTWIKDTDCNISNGKCYDKFTVTLIEYDEIGNISKLEIKNENTHKIAFKWKSGLKVERPKANKPSTKITKAELEEILVELCDEKRFLVKELLERTGVDKTSDLSEEQLSKWIDWLEAK